MVPILRIACIHPENDDPLRQPAVNDGHAGIAGPDDLQGAAIFDSLGPFVASQPASLGEPHACLNRLTGGLLIVGQRLSHVSLNVLDPRFRRRMG